MNRHTEQEWQFAARELEPARQWLATRTPRIDDSSSERRFAPQPTLTVRDTYYDSPDWMIFRAGFALRVRHSRPAVANGISVEGDRTEITLKSLSNGHGGLARRTEVSEQVGSADLEQVLARDQGIGGRIRELIGARQLTPLFHANTRRERQQLLEADSNLPLAEVDLDETSIETPSGQSLELRRVEVECIHAEPGALSPLVEELREAAQLEPVDVSKFRAGLAAAGLTPFDPQSLGSTTISASKPFAEAQLATFRRYFALVLDKEGEVRAGSATALHEMRVAARHLDVLLRVFRGFGPAWAMASRGRVQGLIKSLGAVRDCDVQLAFLEGARAARGPDDRAALAPVQERLVAQRSKARARLLQSLDSPPVQAWMREWRQNLTAATPGSNRAQRATTARVARDLIREQARCLRKRAERIGENSSPDDYHEVRIRAKRLRYTLDAFASLYGDAASEFTAALAKLQTVLGEYNDSMVREKRFTELVANGPRLSPATSFLVGRLVERDVRAFDRCRERFTRAYRRTRRSRWRALTEGMKQLAADSSGSTGTNLAPPA